jgi:hypothetical protein
VCLTGIAIPAAPAHPFCGFYVSGADAKLFNNATQVALMREGTRTVLSMQNNYQGPPENFALVIPVPVILQKENVKTLPREIFDKIDTLTAPRLVEYWEQDPCAPDMGPAVASLGGAGSGSLHMASAQRGGGYGVTIEAQFTVGEYEIVILSAQNATGLDAWLRDNQYKIPDGAEPYLRPYVQKGSKFFVAKVNVQKVKFERIGSGPEQVVLSPLRFHYDSDTFDLPIRLGLINSGGAQDLIVNLLSRGQRYDVANYPNVTIPTNLDVIDGTKDSFAPFYTALFDKTVETHPRAVVTEYAWDASWCDPCPTPALTPSELMTLGADALPSSAPAASGSSSSVPSSPFSTPVSPRRPVPPRWTGGGFVVTRLHARYTKESLGEDLVFRAAPPIQGGREWLFNGGQLEKGAKPGPINNFQARYAIRHPWTGPIACERPIRGRWGGPPGDGVLSSGPGNVKPATKIAYAPRGVIKLASFVREDVPEIGLSLGGGQAPAPSASPPDMAPSVAPSASAPSAAPTGNAPPGKKSSGCAMTSSNGGSSAKLAAWVTAGFIGWRRGARRRRGAGGREQR